MLCILKHHRKYRTEGEIFVERVKKQYAKQVYKSGSKAQYVNIDSNLLNVKLIKQALDKKWEEIGKQIKQI